MIRVNLRDIPIGTKLAQNLLNSLGQLLLPKGTVLDEYHRDKLLALGINEIFLDGEVPEFFRQPVEQQDIRVEGYLRLGVQTMRELMERVKSGRSFSLQESNNLIELLIPEVQKSPNLLGHLLKIKDKDEYMLEHSIGVSTFAMFIGRLLGYPIDGIKDLGMAGLLHDLGKCLIPDEILQKPGQLTPVEFQEIKKHPLYSYRLLSDSKEVNDLVKLAVLQHHEQFDGKGYPLMLHDERLHEFARIVSVADMFDAMISNRVYKPGVSVFQAAEEIFRNCFGKVDPEIALKFIEYLGNQCVGKSVRLNTGEKAQIVLYHSGEPGRPLIRVGDKFIDLRYNRNYNIVQVLF